MQRGAATRKDPRACTKVAGFTRGRAEVREEEVDSQERPIVSVTTLPENAACDSCTQSLKDDPKEQIHC